MIKKRYVLILLAGITFLFSKGIFAEDANQPATDDPAYVQAEERMALQESPIRAADADSRLKDLQLAISDLQRQVNRVSDRVDRNDRDIRDIKATIIRRS
jgi:peptidoglycan hydrolase CwlO-like protein